MSVEALASYQHCVERIHGSWSPFQAKRQERLRQQERQGTAAEKVAENILEDLFSGVLDWSLGDINNQVHYADLLLTRLGIKYLIVEVKRPSALAWSRGAVERALDQALRYAGEQKVHCVAVSDGCMLYAADVAHGGLQDRVFVDLGHPDPQEALWWLSVHGVYRPRTEAGDAALRLLPELPLVETPPSGVEDEALLHPKYHVPASCFAYIGNAADPHTWKLPYCNADGTLDLKRLPKAIQAILSNYRGVKVSGIPEPDVPDVLVRLARAAARAGKMPQQGGETAEVYHQLAEALDQLDRLNEISG